METIFHALGDAGRLLVAFDPNLVEIVSLSLTVSLTAVLIATALALPLGAAIAVAKFPGRQTVIVILNALMGLPPVVVGLLVYLILSRAGPLGPMGLLFTPTAMVIAQTILILPIIAALARQAVEDAWREYQEQLRSLGARGGSAALTLVWDIRFSLLTAVLAGLGRAAAEVGAVMIVGGNIDGVTRVMTTAIALETSKGDLRASARARDRARYDRAAAERRGVRAQGSRAAAVWVTNRCARRHPSCRCASTRFPSWPADGRSSIGCRSSSRPARGRSSWGRTAPGRACSCGSATGCWRRPRVASSGRRPSGRASGGARRWSSSDR